IVLAGVVVSAGRWVRPRIERVFLRERYTLAAGLARLRAELGGVEEPGAMLRLVAGRLAVLLRLERCALYARRGTPSCRSRRSAPAGRPPSPRRGRWRR